MTGRWFSPGTSVSSTNKTDHHDTCITEILLKVALNTINPNPPFFAKPYIQFCISEILCIYSISTLKFIQFGFQATFAIDWGPVDKFLIMPDLVYLKGLYNLVFQFKIKGVLRWRQKLTDLSKFIIKTHYVYITL